MSAPLIDPFARAITYLRVSVTDRCDFRCVYCMSENMQFLPTNELLTLEELDRMCSTFIGMGVEKVMGFCTPDEYEEFLRSCPEFQVGDGTCKGVDQRRVHAL